MEPLSGSALVLLAITISLLALSWLSFVLRVAARRLVHALALDDLLMGLGVISFTIVCGLIVAICFEGAGLPSEAAPDYKLVSSIINPAIFCVLLLTGLVCAQNYFMAEIFYHLSGVLVKCSITLALIRVCKSKPLNRVLWAIVGLVCLSCFAYITGLLKVCAPVSAMWHAGTGSCDVRIQLGIAYFCTAVYVVVDGTLAILPIYMLWGTKMDNKTRYCAAIVLASAALVSCATIARLHFVHKLFYNEVTDGTVRMSLATWSLVEEGISITAGSVPMVRHLVDTKRFRRPAAYPDASRSSTSSWPPRPYRTVTSIETGDAHDWDGVPGGNSGSQWHILRELRFSVHSSRAELALPASVYLGW